MLKRATRALVGIVGLGLMGEVYAQRLIDAKFPVVGFDIDPAARRFQVGQVGDGGRAKLAVNLVLGLNRLALAEGLV